MYKSTIITADILNPFEILIEVGVGNNNVTYKAWYGD